MATLEDPELDESPIIRRDSRIIEIDRRIKVRVVHTKAATTRNPLPASLPVFVMIHGLGGQVSQFDALIDVTTNYADILAIDMPGCGGSPYDPTLPRSYYTTDSLIRLLEKVITAELGPEREIILIGHSLGSAVCCYLSKLVEHRCRALICICPPTPLSDSMKRMQLYLTYAPTFLFDVFRYNDRKGGLNSPSIERGYGDLESLDEQHQLRMRRRQLRWNLQVRTPVWLKIFTGTKIPEGEDWAQVRVPTLVIGAVLDKVTPVDAVDFVTSFINGCNANQGRELAKSVLIPHAGHMCLVEVPETVCGLINDFIIDNVDQRISLGWQLAELATRDDKWSLKNEEKWRKVQLMSPIIGPSCFRAMKTLRQDDPEQNPMAVEKRFPDITDIIDISRDHHPPYDPQSFKRIRYHKFPTVSKMPPTRSQVNGFIELVDRIKSQSRDGVGKHNIVIGVHCHYGFNRTGFVICSYMIQRMGISVRDAIEYFKEAKPPGIKHPHFIDELYVRYTL
ncbi:Alpha/Beta hydrolase protein [Dipodascopsis uninucleata]